MRPRAEGEQLVETLDEPGPPDDGRPAPATGDETLRAERRQGLADSAAGDAVERRQLRPETRQLVLEWQEKDGSVVLNIRRSKTWKTSLINMFVPMPE